jgi:hypothetical protein
LQLFLITNIFKMNFLRKLFDNSFIQINLLPERRESSNSTPDDLGSDTLSPISDFGLTESASAQILSEIDIDAAIAAHQSWKRRLSNYLADESKEKLSPDIVRSGEYCILGKSLHGSGQAKLGKHQSFAMLLEQHKRFHIEAAKVVSLTYEKKYDEAAEVLNKGYAHASGRVVWLLLNLKRNIRYSTLIEAV